MVPHSHYLFFCRQNLIDLIEVHLSSLFFIALRDPQCPLYFGKKIVFPYRSPSTANLIKNKGYGDYAAVLQIHRARINTILQNVGFTSLHVHDKQSLPPVASATRCLDSPSAQS